MSTMLLEAHAREFLGMSEEWHAYVWEAGPHERPSHLPPLYYKIKGAVAPLKTKGPDAGKARNWSKRDKTTDRIFITSPTEHDAWCEKWSEKTGKCIECTGEGKVFSGWNYITGTRYRECRKCNGTGQRATANRKEGVRL